MKRKSIFVVMVMAIAGLIICIMLRRMEEKKHSEEQVAISQLGGTAVVERTRSMNGSTAHTFAPSFPNARPDQGGAPDERPQKLSGPNKEFFKRESRLTDLAKQLHVGMSGRAVTNYLGNPHFPFAYVTNGHLIQRQRVPLEEAAFVHVLTYWLYTPNFDDSFVWDGTGYQELVIHFDTNRQVAKWEWETPVVRVRMKLPKDSETK